MSLPIYVNFLFIVVPTCIQLISVFGNQYYYDTCFYLKMNQYVVMDSFDTFSLAVMYCLTWGITQTGIPFLYSPLKCTGNWGRIRMLHRIFPLEDVSNLVSLKTDEKENELLADAAQSRPCNYQSAINTFSRSM